MNHLLKKLSFAGGGKHKPKAQPATLTPPIIGDLALASSYSYAEILDLISDGPIGGLVNLNGLDLQNGNILQGIYLNDTSVAVSDDSVLSNITSYDSSFVAQEMFNSVNNLSDFFTNLLNFNIPVRSDLLPPQGYTTINYLNNLRVSIGELFGKFVGGIYTTYTPLTNVLFDDYDNLLGSFNGSRTAAYPYELNYSNSKVNTWMIGTNLAYDTRYQLQFYNNTDTQITNYINNYLGEIKTLITNYNNCTIHEKTYLNNIFIKYFGSDWESKDSSNLLNNWAISNFDFANDLIFIINPISSTNISLIDIRAVSLLDSLGALNNFEFSLETSDGVSIANYDNNISVYDFILPSITPAGVTTGQCKGLYIVRVKGMYNFSKPKINYSYYLFSTFNLPSVSIQNLANAKKLNLRKKTISTGISTSTQKYNYTNILAEYRSGEEYQNPFKWINSVLIDKEYGSSLIGPFKTSGNVQRITEDSNMLSNNYWRSFNLIIGSKTILPTTEGSVDANFRISSSADNYSDWNKSQSVFNESAISVKHIIINPNVESVFITIMINGLSDTLSADASVYIDKINTKQLRAGTKFPAIVNIEVETGCMDDSGAEDPTQKSTRNFQIVALIASPTYIDIGNPDGKTSTTTNYKFISEYTQDSGVTKNIFEPFMLPKISGSNSALDSSKKRYIKITKLSCETNSSLINKNIALSKVTEIIPANFSYPFSAVIGTKIDSRAFSSIPTRTFDCKLKKVKIPSNYNPVLTNGKDKRYYSKISNFNTTSLQDKRVYDGDWDGDFKKDKKGNYLLEWTDNPAWILYDIITNERYGLGQYLDASQISIFDLYKIGRFCDAVDNEGYFVGVSDNAGGLEPRFSCNIMFQDGMKVFDALNTIASLFRGVIYYSNSQINFVDDRPKDPIALFTNTNVKDGSFNYTNYRRDEQFNSIEVVYIDRFENFLTKVEYVEDEEDIRKRGVFKKTINANGVTSRAMARRIGQHIIYQTIKENQSISFTAGLDSLLCRPGDLILVEDDLKSLKSNFGKILSVNTNTNSIRLNEKFVSGDYLNKLTVYTPTGYSTNDDILAIQQSQRSRLTGFSLTGSFLSPTLNYLTGDYIFSSYSDGYTGSVSIPLQNQYAYYTGNNYNYCYFSVKFTGWVFGTGLPFKDNNLYDKFISKNTGDYRIVDINTGSGYVYSTASADRRSGSAINISGKIRNNNNSGIYELKNTTNGLLDSDISLSSPSQITTFSISGITEYNYGCEVFVDQRDINYNLVPFVKAGSTYRFQRNLADEQIFKVISIKEQNPNEYNFICTKFDTGKYALIENETSISHLSNTYSYTLSQKINNTNYLVLSPPTIQTVSTGINPANSNAFYISGSWKNVSNSTGYNVRLYSPNGTFTEQDIAPNLTIQSGNAVFYTNQSVGSYSFRVNALGNISTVNNPNVYFNSDYSSSGLFIIYNDTNMLNYDRSFLSSLRIL